MGTPTPPPEPEPLPDEDELEEIAIKAELFEEMGLNPFEAFACAYEGLSPSLLREFLRKNPKCDVLTAVEILL